jgi:GT2 family glycosyltransferase
MVSNLRPVSKDGIIRNMARVTLIQVYYNHRRFIDKVFPAALNQTYTDTEFIVVIAGNEDGGKEYIAEKYPQARIIDPGYNIGFAKGHNELFKTIDSEFFQLVNPDLILQPDYVEKMLAAFNDPKVGAATGKLLQYNFNEDKSTNIIDTTGVILYKTGRGRDRGQHEVDRGQYDHHRKVIAVSGAGPMYRKAALEAVKYVREDGVVEYFDQDFHTYWEDVDLALRMTNAGYDCWFVPGAVGYHGRGVASTNGGY